MAACRSVDGAPVQPQHAGEWALPLARSDSTADGSAGVAEREGLGVADDAVLAGGEGQELGVVHAPKPITGV
jgi:hypothetical protein